MGYLEIFEMNENGAGWVNVNDLPLGEVMAIEIELATQPTTAQLLCAMCLTPIPSGMGHSFCDRCNR
jgi:hypothetical protein